MVALDYRHILLPVGRGALLPCLSYPSFFSPPQLLSYSSCPPPSPHFPWSGFLPLLLLPTHLTLSLVAPHQEPFGCLKDSPVPLPRLFFCSGPQRCFNSKHQGGNLRWPFGYFELPEVFDFASISSIKLPAWSRVLPTSHRPKHYTTA